MPRATGRGQGSRRELRDQNHSPHPSPTSPLRAPSPPKLPQEEGPLPHSVASWSSLPQVPPTPSPPYSLWSPLESRCGSQTDSFLKETGSKGGRWQGFCVPLWAGRGSCGASARAPSLRPLGLEAPGAPPLHRWGLGDRGAGVNRVSGSGICVCHRPVGATGEAAHPGAGKQEGHRAGGVREGHPAPLPTLSRALGPRLPAPAKPPSLSSLDELPGLPASDPCSPLPPKGLDGL